jgi:hypothetical protein
VGVRRDGTTARGGKSCADGAADVPDAVPALAAADRAAPIGVTGAALGVVDAADEGCATGAGKPCGTGDSARWGEVPGACGALGADGGDGADVVIAGVLRIAAVVGAPGPAGGDACAAGACWPGVCTADVCAGEACPVEVCAAGACGVAVGACPAEVCGGEACFAEVCAGDACPVEGCVGDACPAGAGAVRVADVGRIAVAPGACAVGEGSRISRTGDGPAARGAAAASRVDGFNRCGVPTIRRSGCISARARTPPGNSAVASDSAPRGTATSRRELPPSAPPAGWSRAGVPGDRPDAPYAADGCAERRSAAANRPLGGAGRHTGPLTGLGPWSADALGGAGARDGAAPAGSPTAAEPG